MHSNTIIRRAVFSLFVIGILVQPVAAANEGVVRTESEILDVVTLKGPAYQFGEHVSVPRTARLVSRRRGEAGFETHLEVRDAYEAPAPRRYAVARIEAAGLSLSPVQTVINEIPGVSDYEEIVEFPLPLDKLPKGQAVTIELVNKDGANRQFQLPADYIAMQRKAIAGEGDG